MQWINISLCGKGLQDKFWSTEKLVLKITCLPSSFFKLHLELDVETIQGDVISRLNRMSHCFKAMDDLPQCLNAAVSVTNASGAPLESCFNIKLIHVDGHYLLVTTSKRNDSNWILEKKYCGWRFALRKMPSDLFWCPWESELWENDA